MKTEINQFCLLARAADASVDNDDNGHDDGMMVMILMVMTTMAMMMVVNTKYSYPNYISL